MSLCSPIYVGEPSLAYLSTVFWSGQEKKNTHPLRNINKYLLILRNSVKLSGEANSEKMFRNTQRLPQL